MDPLPDIYPLTSLQIGDMQSYISRAFLYFAPVSKKVLILVDNQPWMTGKQSRSARLWQFMITKYRMSPFVNLRSGTDTAAAMATTDKRKITTAMRRWLAVANSTPALLHGFLVFEVSWRDVHGINYYNDLLTDTSLALEARYLNKWEFYSAEQAAGCVSQWFLGRASETHSLQGYLLYYHHYHHRPRHHRSSAASAGEEEHARDDVMMMAASSSGDERCTPRAATLRRRMSWRSRARRKNLQQQKYTDRQDQEEEEKEGEDEGLRVPMHMHMHMHMQQYRYNDTLLLFRSRDAALPFKLRQIITSDIRLLTLLESGLPSWVIFLQSYPVLCHMYRPWMRPLARSLYVLASLVTVIIGFYDLYKNVPLLKSAAARICGPLFEWIETWDMVTRIQYLGTILFLRNLRKFMQGLLTLLQAARALLRVMLAPLADLGLCQLLATLGVLASHAWGLVVDLAEVVWAPFDVVLDCVARVVSSLWPVLKVVVLPARFVVAVAACAGSVLSNSYNFFKDIWETLSSIFELNHMSEAQQSAFDMTTLKTLWNDLFSQIFRAIRGILNGILVFFYACNRHRLSIYNHAQTRLRNMLRVTRLAPKQHAPCHCNSTTKHPNHEDAPVQCDVCK
ncbi:hypothetical protein CFC21_009567 [Triticum aestivum]|uniref:Uncharacterized protein n=3 Tax=Triticum aestivum TaxID=4565 RepID=A0A3B5Z5Z5_WHEAT|nr:uncharacterized protein LOC119351030 [Triticum dicoccoides]KAF6992591.1 hypothetical protein CFC21_009567 [Triticum aestivum]